jgi:hypothetical protein
LGRALQIWCQRRCAGNRDLDLQEIPNTLTLEQSLKATTCSSKKPSLNVSKLKLRYDMFLPTTLILIQYQFFPNSTSDRN